MTASNRYIPIACPKCGHPMKLGDSDDTIDSDNSWDAGQWEECFTCPQCQTEFSMNVKYDITITSIEVAYIEGKEDR